MNTLRWMWLLAAAMPAGVMGAGYYLPNQDALATARGNAWVATADRAAAVHYNPAGLTQLTEREAEAGAYLIQLGNTYKGGGTKVEAKEEVQAVPHLYFAEKINDRLAWGFGINSPFGLGTEWGQNTPFRAVVTEARLTYVSATTALAYRVTETLSLGGSLSLNYANLILEQGVGPAPGFLKFEGDGVSVGGQLSARWQPHEKHAFGLVVSSETSLDLEGRVNSSINALDGKGELDFMTPMRLAAGYSYRPAPGWNLEANVEWLDWDSLDSLPLNSTNLNTRVPFGWDSMFIYEVGVSYTFENGYQVACGYDYNRSAQPDANYNPGVADADRHWFNAGFGRRTEVWDWFVTYQFGYSNRNVSESLVPEANGKYESRHHALVLSANYRF